MLVTIADLTKGIFKDIQPMTDCEYCCQPLLEEYEIVDNTLHRQCDEEWLRRANAGKCVACGDADKLSEGYRCLCCSENNRVFQGYPGA